MSNKTQKWPTTLDFYWGKEKLNVLTVREEKDYRRRKDELRQVIAILPSWEERKKSVHARECKSKKFSHYAVGRVGGNKIDERRETKGEGEDHTCSRRNQKGASAPREKKSREVGKTRKGVSQSRWQERGTRRKRRQWERLLREELWEGKRISVLKKKEKVSHIFGQTD